MFHRDTELFQQQQIQNQSQHYHHHHHHHNHQHNHQQHYEKEIQHQIILPNEQFKKERHRKGNNFSL